MKHFRDMVENMVESGRVRDELDRVLRDPVFVSSPRLSQLLRFTVETAIAGKAENLKETSIAVSIFGRPPDYDPRTDPIVRVHAGRLRTKLEQFYSKDSNQNSDVVINLPKGSYVPTFHASSDPNQVELIKRKPAWPWIAAGSVAFVCLLSVIVLKSGHVAAHAPYREPGILSALAGNKNSPAWSADGMTLAYAWYREGKSVPKIYLHKLGDTEGSELTNSGNGELKAAWSPRGDELAILRQNGRDRFDVVIVRLKGRTERKLTEFTHFNFSLAPPDLDWSPDGEHLLISEQETRVSPSRIRLVSIRDGQSRLLTKPAPASNGDLEARFSPDGKRVAFRRGGWGDLWTVTLNGEEHRVTTDYRGVRGISWNPDGNSILFGSYRGNLGLGVWKTSAAGGGVESVSPMGFIAG